MTKFYFAWSTKPAAGPMVLEATSPGQAVEYFLACHGLFGYEEPISLMVIDDPEMHASVSACVPDKDAAALDEHHRWKDVRPEEILYEVQGPAGEVTWP